MKITYGEFAQELHVRILIHGQEIFDVVIESEINAAENSVSPQSRRQPFVKAGLAVAAFSHDLPGRGKNAGLIFEADLS